MIVQLSSSGPLFKARDNSSVAGLDVFYDPILTDPTIVSETIGEVVYNKATALGALPRYRLSPTGGTLENFAITNTTADKATLDSGTLTAIEGQTGNARIVIGSSTTAATSHLFSVAATGSSISYTLTGFVAETLGAITFANITAKLDAEKDSLYYNGSTYAAAAAQSGGIQRNPNCWGAAYDLSGVAVTHLLGGFKGGGAAVTARHYLASHHYNPSNKVGMLLRFVGNDGSIHTRTVLAQTTGSEIPGNITNPLYPIGDVCMFLLSGPDLPASVTKYKVAGDWYELAVLNSESGGVGSYTIKLHHAYITANQNRKVLFVTATTDWFNFSQSTTPTEVNLRGFTYNAKPWPTVKYTWGPRYTAFADVQADPIPGDSGTPLFLPMANNELVLCSHMTSTTDGPLLHAGLLNAMIAEVDDRAGISTGLTVTVATDPTI